jgi:hypothetical protein
VTKASYALRVKLVSLRERAPSPDFDVLGLLADVQGRDFASLLHGDRVKLSIPGAPKEALAAIEAEINLRLEVNRGWTVEHSLPWAIASVLAGYFTRYDHPEMEAAMQPIRERCAPAMPAFLRTIGLEPGAQRKKSFDADRFLPSGRPEIEGDLFIPGRAGFGRGSLIRALIQQHERTEPKMPILSKLRERFGSPELMKAVSFFSVQHVLGSTRGLFHELESMGLHPKMSFVVGKNYSTDGITRLRFSGYNFSNLPMSHGLPGSSAWTPKPGPKAEELVDQLLDYYAELLTVDDLGSSKHPAKLPPETEVLIGGPRPKIDTAVILDDGAEAIARASNDPHRFGKRLVAVEQTRFGANRIRALGEIPFAAINVAESAVKLHLESVLIGWSVAHEIDRIIEKLSREGLKKGDQVTLLGYGAVGRATALVLDRLGYEVSVFDKDETKRSAAKEDGFAVAEDDGAKIELLSKSDLVVGATGQTALTKDELEQVKDGAVLFSASSSTIEFAAGDAPDLALVEPNAKEGETPRLRFQGLDLTAGVAGNRDHWHRAVEVKDRELLLACSGYPVNLTGARDPISPSLIQLTRSLLLLGAMQAVKLDSSVRGLVELDREGQLFIAREWVRAVRADDLLPPDLLALVEEGMKKVESELS